MNDPPPAKLTRDTHRAISRSVVNLLKEHLGRGPVRAKTYVHDDSVLVLMSDGHTVSEETLSEAGQAEAVASQRIRSFEAIHEQLTAVIEAETHRQVIGCMSTSQQHPSLLAYVFVLDSHDLLKDDDQGSDPDSEDWGRDAEEPA